MFANQAISDKDDQSLEWIQDGEEISKYDGFCVPVKETTYPSYSQDKNQRNCAKYPPENVSPFLFQWAALVIISWLEGLVNSYRKKHYVYLNKEI